MKLFRESVLEAGPPMPLQCSALNHSEKLLVVVAQHTLPCKKWSPQLPGHAQHCPVKAVWQAYLKSHGCVGEISGGQLVQDGALKADSFRFFAGMLEWGPGQLALEINSGIW